MWKFLESDDDGVIWLENPDQLSAIVEFDGLDENDSRGRFRLMVVTRGWLQAQLAGVRMSDSGPLFAWMPSLLVVPDVKGDALRECVDRALKERASALYGANVGL